MALTSSGSVLTHQYANQPLDKTQLWYILKGTVPTNPQVQNWVANNVDFSKPDARVQTPVPFGQLGISEADAVSTIRAAAPYQFSSVFPLGDVNAAINWKVPADKLEAAKQSVSSTQPAAPQPTDDGLAPLPEAGEGVQQIPQGPYAGPHPEAFPEGTQPTQTTQPATTTTAPQTAPPPPAVPEPTQTLPAQPTTNLYSAPTPPAVNPTNAATSPPLPEEYQQRGIEYNYQPQTLAPPPTGFNPFASPAEQQAWMAASSPTDQPAQAPTQSLPTAPPSGQQVVGGVTNPETGQTVYPTATGAGDVQQQTAGTTQQRFTPGAAGDIHNNPENWPFPREPQISPVNIPDPNSGSTTTGTSGSDVGPGGLPAPTQLSLPPNDPHIYAPRQENYNAPLANTLNSLQTPMERGATITHDDPGVNLLLQEAQAGYQKANAANEAKYQQVLALQDEANQDLYGPGGIYPEISRRYRWGESDAANRLSMSDRVMADRFAGGQQDRQAITGAFQDRENRGAAERQNITSGWLNRQDSVLDLMSGLGDAERADVERLYEQRRAANMQSLASRGLGNTTVAQSVDAGTTRNQVADQGRLSERLRREQGDYASRLSADALSAAERNLGAQEGLSGQRIDSMERNLDSYENLARDYANSLNRTANDWTAILGQGNAYSERMADNYNRSIADLTNFIASRNDTGPDIGMIANLMTSAGGAAGLNAGTFGASGSGTGGGYGTQASRNRQSMTVNGVPEYGSRSQTAAQSAAGARIGRTGNFTSGTSGLVDPGAAVYRGMIRDSLGNETPWYTQTSSGAVGDTLSGIQRDDSMGAMFSGEQKAGLPQRIETILNRVPPILAGSTITDKQVPTDPYYNPNPFRG